MDPPAEAQVFPASRGTAWNVLEHPEFDQMVKHICMLRQDASKPSLVSRPPGSRSSCAFPGPLGLPAGEPQSPARGFWPSPCSPSIRHALPRYLSRSSSSKPPAKSYACGSRCLLLVCVGASMGRVDCAFSWAHQADQLFFSRFRSRIMNNYEHRPAHLLGNLCRTNYD